VPIFSAGGESFAIPSDGHGRDGRRLSRERLAAFLHQVPEAEETSVTTPQQPAARDGETRDLVIGLDRDPLDLATSRDIDLEQEAIQTTDEQGLAIRSEGRFLEIAPSPQHGLGKGLEKPAVPEINSGLCSGRGKERSPRLKGHCEYTVPHGQGEQPSLAPVIPHPNRSIPPGGGEPAAVLVEGEVQDGLATVPRLPPPGLS
jgi:hypothetical protein